MRITNSMIYRFGVNGAQQQRELLAQIQERASTGKNINRPSDDPVRVRATTLLRDGLAQISQYERNITTSRLRLSTTESALNGAFEVIGRARTLAIDGANGTQNADSRRLISQEVEQLHDQLLREANSRDANGGRVFAGYANDTDPFQVSGDFVSGSPPPTVAFVGDSSELFVDIDEGIDMQVTLSGDRVFQGTGGGEDLFAIVEDLWTALDTNDQVGIQNVITRLETAETQLSAERTTIGSSDAQAELWEQRHRNNDAMLQEQLSEFEDADSIEVFSELVQQEAALQGSMEVTSRILQTNLLNFL